MTTFIGWIAELVAADAPKRSRKNRGVVVESSLDPLPQRFGETAGRVGLRRLRSRPGLGRSVPLQAALVALDVATGDVLAHVSSDPARPEAFDRVRSANRRPGSTVKPMMLLEAFQDCGPKQPLHPATRVVDAPVTVSLGSGEWSPENSDNSFRGVVEIRDAVEQSLNVPFVRVAENCGFRPTARRLRRAGLSLPEEPPPSFVLGSVETTPVELARAYTVFAPPGAVVDPRPVLRLSAPAGRGLERYRVKSQRVTRVGDQPLPDRRRCHCGGRSGGPGRSARKSPDLTGQVIASPVLIPCSRSTLVRTR